MFFDDRLGTVLRQRAGGDAIARIQYRQLLDLLGTMPSEADGPQVDAAYQRLAEISARIPTPARAAMLGEQGMRLRSARLVALLASAEPAVAAAAIARAELTGDQWRDLAPALPLHARGVMRARRDLGEEFDRRLAGLGIVDRGLPVSEEAAAAAASLAAETVVEFPARPEAVSEARPSPEGIGDIVRRIEKFREARRVIDGEVAISDSPRLPLGEQAAAAPPSSPLRCFDFSTDGEGRIVWAEGAAGPMAFGMRLASEDPLAPLAGTPALAAAFRKRQPIRAGLAEIAGAPAIAGGWQIDAAPVFDAAGGRFTGYAGRMRRAPEATAAVAPVPADNGRDADKADRMRQLLHELRTPVNAIQGFAEVIQQQLFGPSPHEYRALAAAIAGDAARMLAGFDELDRLARLDTGALALEDGESDLVPVFSTTVARLEGFTAARGGGFALRIEDAALPVALSQADAERLAWRLLGTLAGAAAPGETLKLRLRRRDGGGRAWARLSLDLPQSLSAAEDDAIFQPAVPAIPPVLSAGMFGAGFALRLARAEVNAANGVLERRKGRLRLTLPLLTAQAGANSHSLAGRG